MVSVTDDTPTTIAGGGGAINPLAPMAFILGGSEGNLSLEEIKRRRAIALALAARQKGYPKTFGEGLTYLGESIGDRMSEERLAAQERAYMGGRRADPLFNPPGVGAPAVAAPAARPAAAAPAVAPPAGAPVPYGGLGAGTLSEAPGSDVKDRIAALLTPQEVAQTNPTDGAETPRGQASGDDGVWSARANAIGGIESGGRGNPYATVGVPTKYGRALGRYGVVEANVPVWTQEALGQPLTPQQFLADPQAQDAVFKHRFGEYVDKYGEEGAARAWYAGAGGRHNLNATDAFGRLTVKSYGQDYLNRLQGQQRGAPTAALATGTTSDAPPLGVPTDENPPTPTSIQPMPVQVAQMGAGAALGPGSSAMGPNPVPMPADPRAPAGMPPGIPGPLARPTPVPPNPTVGRTPIPPSAMERREPPKAPIPDSNPSDEELRAMAIVRKYPGDEQALLQAQQLAAFGKSRREAIYLREVEKYKLDYGAWEKIDLAEREAYRNQPKTELELRKGEEELGAKQRAEEKQRRLGGIPDDTWQKVLGESQKEVKNIPAATMQLANAKRALLDEKMFTGSTADIELSWAKFRSAMGMPADPRIAPTEQFKSFISVIVAQARQMMAGGANISDKDMEAARAAAAGDIKLDRESIKGVLSAVERLNTQMAVSHHQKLLTYAGNDEDAQRATFGAYELPMHLIVPDDAVRILRAGAANPAKAAEVIKDFNETFHTPGLAQKVLQSNRGR